VPGAGEQLDEQFHWRQVGVPYTYAEGGGTSFTRGTPYEGRALAILRRHRAVKLKGEFVWHKHVDTDELFLVTKGRLAIRLRDREVSLGPGELLVVPKRVEHQPMAEEECEVLLIEPAGTPNTADTGGARTAPPEWI
jgi:mannose-6-phosphate isomerase-like protein (cupin superfamily)